MRGCEGESRKRRARGEQEDCQGEVSEGIARGQRDVSEVSKETVKRKQPDLHKRAGRNVKMCV